MVLRQIRHIFALLMLMLTMACSSDQHDTALNGEGALVDVTMRICTLNGGGNTRAWDGTLENSEAKELMRNWLIVVVNSSDDKVEKVIASDQLDNMEQDYTKEELTPGTKRFYSFANISLVELNASVGTEIVAGTVLTHGMMSTAMIKPHGNNWDGKRGILMSNWQEATVSGEKQTIVLYLCRTIAKMRFEIKNITSLPIIVKNISISDITQNNSGTRLMPSVSITDAIANGGQGAPALMPNLPDAAADTIVNILKGDGSDAITIAAGTKQTATVYVNESEIKSTSRYGLFQLTLTIDRGGSEEELRFALISNDNSNWTYISRNDSRTIPLTLDDYKLDVIPVDYPPIGVYPASVKEEDGVFTCTFHAEGEFAYIPVVTRYSNGEQLQYGYTENTWNYVDGSWTTDNPKGIYQTTPQWNGTDHRFEGAFNNTMGEAYHEFMVRVNKGGSAQQTLTYRLWTIRK